MAKPNSIGGRGSQDALGFEQASSLCKQPDGIMNVLDDMAQDDRIVGFWLQIEVGDQAFMNSQTQALPGKLRGLGVHFLPFHLPSVITELCEPAAIAASDFKQASRFDPVQIHEIGRATNVLLAGSDQP